MRTLFERMADVQRVPPPTNEDRLPHDKAVWRDDRFPHIPLHVEVSLDFGDGLIEQTTAGRADWSRLPRWRFGWAPR